MLMEYIIQTFWEKKMRPAMRKKRPVLLETGPILLHNNATPHKSWHMTSVIDEYKWGTLKHPAYSPDLNPCDFDLFPELNKSLRGIKFEDLDEHKVAVIGEVRRIFSGCLATGIWDLPNRWIAVIQRGGNYFEGL